MIALIIRGYDNIALIIRGHYQSCHYALIRLPCWVITSLLQSQAASNHHGDVSSCWAEQKRLHILLPSKPTTKHEKHVTSVMKISGTSRLLHTTLSCLQTTTTNHFIGGIPRKMFWSSIWSSQVRGGCMVHLIRMFKSTQSQSPTPPLPPSLLTEKLIRRNKLLYGFILIMKPWSWNLTEPAWLQPGLSDISVQWET